MKKILLSVIYVATLSTSAFASGYGKCSDSIHEYAENLIAPLQPILKLVPVTEKISVGLIAGNELGDSIIKVNSEYQAELHASLNANFDKHGAWLGVVETRDGAGDPALWMYIWSNTADGCVYSAIDNRVYDERVNAPNIFWDAIKHWEELNPDKILIEKHIQKYKN